MGFVIYGEWLFKLIKKSFHYYWEKGNAEYFKEKYKSVDVNFLYKKLVIVTARNISLIGGLIGAAVSVDEILGIMEAIETPITLESSFIVANNGNIILNLIQMTPKIFLRFLLLQLAVLLLKKLLNTE